MEENPKENPKMLLRRAGIKATKIRIAVLDLFSHGCKPLSASDIFDSLRRQKTDLVTVYRTLTSFENAVILRRVDLRKDSVYFELADHHHHHIVCTLCGRTEEFSQCDIDKLFSKALQRSKNFNTVTGHSFELFGLCNTCSKNLI